MRPELERRLAVLVEPLERAVLDGIREFEADPQRVRVELGLVPVFADERPLVGLAGLIDWRSSGRLSAVLRSGFFRGAAGEQLLMPGERRWPVDRLVLLGLGPRAEFNDRRARELGSRVVAIAAGLSTASVLVALPGTSIERSLVELAFASLLDAIERAELEQGQEIVTTPSDRVDARAEAEPENPSTAGKDAIPSEGEGADPVQAQADPDAKPDAQAEAMVGDRGGEGQPDTSEREPEREGGSEADTAGAEAEIKLAAKVEEPIEGRPALESQQQEPLGSANSPVPRWNPRWWVVVDEALVARLRRVRSGPPKAARGGPSLDT